MSHAYELYSGNLIDGGLSIKTCIGARTWRAIERVALARAFYHNRSVLVLDEATSALDTETEREIIAEIEHLKGKVSLIVIAHRLSTVKNCHRIYRLQKGRIVESGTPQEVLGKED